MLKCQLYSLVMVSFHFRSKTLSPVNIGNFETYLCKKCFVKLEEVLTNLTQQVQRIHGNMDPENLSIHSHTSKRKYANIKRCKSLISQISKKRRTYHTSRSWDEYTSRNRLTSGGSKKYSTKFPNVYSVENDQVRKTDLEEQKHSFSIHSLREYTSRNRLGNSYRYKHSNRNGNRSSVERDKINDTHLGDKHESFSWDHLRGHASRSRLGNRYRYRYSGSISNRFSVESDQSSNADLEDKKEAFSRKAEEKILRRNLKPVARRSRRLRGSLSTTSNESLIEHGQENLCKNDCSSGSPQNRFNEYNPNLYQRKLSNENGLLKDEKDIMNIFSCLKTDIEKQELNLDVFIESNDNILRDLKEANLLNQSYRQFFSGAKFSSHDIKEQNPALNIDRNIKKYKYQVPSTTKSNNSAISKDELTCENICTSKFKKDDALEMSEYNSMVKTGTTTTVKNEKETISTSVSNCSSNSKDDRASKPIYTLRVKSDDELLIPKYNSNIKRYNTNNDTSFNMHHEHDNVEGSGTQFKHELTNIKNESQDVVNPTTTDVEIKLPSLGAVSNMSSASIPEKKQELCLFKEVLQTTPQQTHFPPIPLFNQGMKREINIEETECDHDFTSTEYFNSLDDNVKDEECDTSYYENLNYSWPMALDELFS